MVVAAAALFTIQPATDAAAQCGKGLCLDTDIANANIAASNAMFDLGDKFLNSLIGHAGVRSAIGRDSEAATGANALVADHFSALAYSASGPQEAASDPLAAYAAAPAQFNAHYRSWLEGYGSRAHTGAQGTFVGDAHTDLGGIAGIGATLTPNLSVGASVDQGGSKIDVVDGTQHSRIDLTQIGLTAAISSGPWGLGIAGIYGFGHIHSNRIETAGEATASYGTRLWAALAELSYYWSKDNWRVVPKVGADWARTSSDSYAETGGTTPVAGSAQTTERARVYGAIELGYTQIADRTLYDISVYGKIIDIVRQDVDALAVTSLIPGIAPLAVPGVVDARIEYATGATFSVRLTSLVRLYAMYDGHFRSGFDSNGGTLGLEVNW
jgi:uncharacterized protein with beta-barrel porin domain